MVTISKTIETSQENVNKCSFDSKIERAYLKAYLQCLSFCKKKSWYLLSQQTVKKCYGKNSLTKIAKTVINSSTNYNEFSFIEKAF